MTTQATTKRKSSLDDDSPVSSRSHSPSPPPKRRKHTILEGFSSLSLASVEPSSPGGLAYTSEPDTADYAPMEDDGAFSVPIALPSSSIPEVKMKSSSWYEPEPDRIVVTNLDSSDEEDNATDDTGTVTISPALLKKIISQSPRELGAPQIALPRNDIQALVLFKPLPLPDIVCGEDKEDKRLSDKASDIFEDDDPMDVEP
ncbi:hypothetical protein DXG01_001342 [Tephrocybe rancida]|nr:hypothetical protein DXG01_001342 [Tephrocybe rancida]